MDKPDVRKVHSSPIFRTGGVAIFISVMCLFIPAVFSQGIFGLKLHSIKADTFALLAASTFMFLVGLVDDVKNLRVSSKLAAQLIAALCVCYFGVHPHSLELPGIFTLNIGWIAWPLTIFWIVGVTNAVNIIDGLDGLATGISAIACGVIAVLAVHSGQPVKAVLMVALLGSLTGFLFFNFHPAKIFMGDCGTMFLGFVLASSSIMCAAKSQSLVALALPAVALGIPVFDTLFSMLRRFLQRRSIFAPDRDHFHHKLLDLGLDQQHAAIVAYVITLVLTGLGMLMMITKGITTLIIFACILLLLVLVFHIVGSINLRKTVTDLQQKRVITSRIKNERSRFETTQLHFRQVRTFDDWWNVVSYAAKKMDFSSLNMSLTNRDGTPRALLWRQNRDGPDHEELLRVDIPVRDRRAGSSPNLRIEVFKNSSLESAGRRVALFTRLLDEFSIANLQKQNRPSSDAGDLISYEDSEGMHGPPQSKSPNT
ncbi:MAG: undecaprenyl/decaprenyl-phosphate alpha-N-acetylglucosaminyl 1-phosphate transferase [Planctomycetota bacterium]|nr:MAG: undecaprenyl/decaprenyl-phosphate alpha-N-acetylglucosaminyl 1-phosphate transferase [Planctomycetota bacterium]